VAESPPPRLTTHCPVCGCEVATFGVRTHLVRDHSSREVLASLWRAGDRADRIIIAGFFIVGVLALAFTALITYLIAT
jgi:hypothetical protein